MVTRSTERYSFALGLFAALSLAVGACSPSPADPVTGTIIAPSDSSAPASAGVGSHGTVQVAPLRGTIYYVRADGGDTKQCTGLADGAYPGSGEAQPCAWDHLFRALPPGGQPILAGGETLVVGAGDYQMGFGAPGSEDCDESGSFGCTMLPLPSGPDPAHPTRLLGAGWDSGCDAPPELWGSGRPWFILDLTDASNVDVGCFEITDHSDCVEGHSGGLACERDNPPFGDWASIGIQAEDSANVHLWDLNIHGLASTGIHAGRLSDWTVENVRIAGNGLAGWDGDLWDDLGDANEGTLTFRHWTVEWNGCGETYPGGQPTGCWAQEAGGYGDGVGTGQTGGDWIIEDSAFLHNTSDGLDLLYHDLGGHITLSRVRAEGNAGNQIKVTGASEITNAVVVGNCAFFEGQPFTHLVDQCRANGNSLALFYTGGEAISLANVTVYGQGDGLLMGGVREGSKCTGEERLVVRNSLFLGDSDYFDPTDITFLFYQEDCAGLRMDSDFNLLQSVKNVECGVDGNFVASGPQDRCTDPQFTGPLSGTTFGMTLAPGAPGIDTGDNPSCAPVDILGGHRPIDGDGDGNAVCDRGAYEALP
ncbi:MAG: hypothetical protein MUO35_10530 [Anaerolineales bacterium]|nr:hypothetical protein [Anaerolineales bacterium]